MKQYNIKSLLIVWSVLLLTPCIDIPDASGNNANSIRVPDDCKTLQEAYKKCLPGGTIILTKGTYSLKECIAVDKPCTITGETDDRSQVVIVSSGKGVFNVNVSDTEMNTIVAMKSLTLETSAHKEFPFLNSIIKKGNRVNSQKTPSSNNEIDEMIEVSSRFNQGVQYSKVYHTERDLSRLYTSLVVTNGHVEINNCSIRSDSGDAICVNGRHSYLNVVSSIIESTFYTGVFLRKHAKCSLCDTTFIGMTVGVNARYLVNLNIKNCRFSKMKNVLRITNYCQCIMEMCKVNGYHNIYGAITVDDRSVLTLKNSDIEGMITTMDSQLNLVSSRLSARICGVQCLSNSCLHAENAIFSNSLVALWLEHSNATFDLCLFESNSTGIYASKSKIVASDCKFQDNAKMPYTWNHEKTMPDIPVSIKCSLDLMRGCGGILIADISNCDLRNCIIHNNGLYGIQATEMCRINMQKCELTDNGIGAEFRASTYGVIKNCKFHSNKVRGIFLQTAIFDIFDSNFYDNQEGIVVQERSQARFKNVKSYNNVLRTSTGEIIDSHLLRDWVVDKGSLVLKN